MNQSQNQPLLKRINTSTVHEWHPPLSTDLLQLQELVELEIRKAAAIAKLPSWKIPCRQKSYRFLKTKWMFNNHEKFD